LLNVCHQAISILFLSVWDYFMYLGIEVLKEVKAEDLSSEMGAEFLLW